MALGGAGRGATIHLQGFDRHGGHSSPLQVQVGMVLSPRLLRELLFGFRYPLSFLIMGFPEVEQGNRC